MANNYSINKNKFLTDEERSKFETVLFKFIEKDRVHVTALLVALHTGARATEVLNLRKQDLDPNSRSLFIKGLKNSNDGEMPINDKIWAIVECLAKDLKPDELLFPMSYFQLRRVWRKYRPAEKKLHCLRHTMALNLYKKSKDIRLVQSALRHRSIVSTMCYQSYVYTTEELRKAIID